ncbi:hypothetical protein QBK99_16420 [Corticibacterium sp. UT-5YL-CI-8]|nr:hypothetical protein [Tianweitania sp. UT-5YL-CI-8]
MAAATRAGAAQRDVAQLEADIAALKADVERLTADLAATSEHGFGAAKRAAAQGAEQLKVQGEAALDSLKTNAKDLEAQVIAHVHEKPITSLAIAAGVGFFFALLTRR